jgi:hypothetical protein
MKIQFIDPQHRPLNDEDLTAQLPAILERIKVEFAKEMAKREREKYPYGDTGKFVYPLGRPFDFDTSSYIIICPIPGTKFRKFHLNIVVGHDNEDMAEMKIYSQD